MSKTIRKARKSKSSRSGLTFPVSKVNRYIRNGRYAPKVGVSSAIYLTGVVEYLAAEVLELAGNAARDNKKRRISPRHIQLAVQNDEELSKLMNDTTIPGAGVLPSIHSVLLPKSKSQKSQK
ncbi:hypothetical protein MHBO_002013 [Bonamia ostreae]|uniref:Histone H2A n=1 Tax=Bonamia ostreae TaxID=126728 RepID=A0ABV2ALQ3_9EUKA